MSDVLVLGHDHRVVVERVLPQLPVRRIATTDVVDVLRLVAVLGRQAMRQRRGSCRESNATEWKTGLRRPGTCSPPDSGWNSPERRRVRRRSVTSQSRRSVTPPEWCSTAFVSDGPPRRRAREPTRLVTACYTLRVARSSVYLSLDEAMALCLILAEAADAISAEEELRDTWVDEARLMIEMILGRTDE